MVVVPVSLSEQVIEALAINELGFEDAVNAAIAKHYVQVTAPRTHSCLAAPSACACAVCCVSDCVCVVLVVRSRTSTIWARSTPPSSSQPRTTRTSSGNNNSHTHTTTTKKHMPHRRATNTHATTCATHACNTKRWRPCSASPGGWTCKLPAGQHGSRSQTLAPPVTATLAPPRRRRHCDPALQAHAQDSGDGRHKGRHKGGGTRAAGFRVHL